MEKMLIFKHKDPSGEYLNDSYVYLTRRGLGFKHPAESRDTVQIGLVEFTGNLMGWSVSLIRTWQDQYEVAVIDPNGSCHEWQKAYQINTHIKIDEGETLADADAGAIDRLVFETGRWFHQLLVHGTADVVVNGAQTYKAHDVEYVQPT